MRTNCILCNHDQWKFKLTVDTYQIVKCTTCGLVFLCNPSSSHQDIERYERYFEQSEVPAYDSHASTIAMRILFELNEQRLNFIKTIVPTGSLLDIGSGRGHFLYHASEFGYRVAGIEISPSAASYCEQTYHIPTSVSNIEEEIILDRKFNIITMWHVLEHLSNPLKVLRNMKNLLACDGVLIMQVPNIHSMKFMLSPKSKKWKGGNHPRYHRFFFSGKTLSLILLRAGFHDIRLIKQSYELSFHSKPKTLTKRMLKYLNLDSFIDVIAR